jgi:DNA-binding transcriptional LysR family regulator
MNRLNWDDLRFFLATARGGGLSPAARELGVNYSTVFRRVNALEDELGVRLFERFAAGYSLTLPGEEMLEHALRIEDEMAALDARVSGRDHRLSGVIRITTVDDVALALLPRHLLSFRAAYPGIGIEMNVDNRFLNLTKREADVAFRMATTLEGDMVGRKLADVAWAVYAAKDYLERHGTPSSAAEIDGHDLIGGIDNLARVPPIAWLGQQAPGTVPCYRSNNLLNQMAAAKAGFGLVALPCFMTADQPELARVLAITDAPVNQFWLLTHPDLRETARIRAFLDFMAKALAADRALLEGRAAAD